ncbi:Carbon monoxide oxygenase (cytochrome b-561) medium subunit [Roseomonas mucosa]|uniref:Carbon monoxide dehydrogenase medium chain n=1 Tax=Roseomonas mucosa TaxID=207340 RepID=A0A379N329_9PROT|nr:MULTISPECIES: xanthine dehydrogenase family protein subunit M [Roseomonas]MBS5901325.1 xanthine dehydrogenase family protein subunit M [Acetobacteraceae bacterium]ATR20286.1 xanthine dehydrogenase family protein subunit M [Roseomonas sp. FDAARGOS_362]MCG7351386.1 xanthine dehydrogenase family protein subunit M [Roseomonas mucosa]MCG7358878.1 xanthine dehydrogenase family protein subunit M [Roseomonas mucosa]MDT8288357.1 xanthine dehydrogenase family protein subunit M [Roseomonas mucosa]
MYDFAYHKPSSLAEAVKLLADPEAKALSGGQTLLPALKHRLNRPSSLVDLTGIAEMKGIRREGDTLVVGALSRHADIQDSDVVRQAIPALARMAGHLGDTQVRNRGTIGGSLANNDPAADYPAAALALGARFVTDRREIGADEFFQGMFTTALEPDELVVALRFPVPEKAGYAKMRNPASRYVLTGVFVAKGPAGVRVVVNGAGPGVFRQAEMEAALAAGWSPEAVAGIRQPPDDLLSDIHGGAEYRAHLVTVMARRAVLDAG